MDYLTDRSEDWKLPKLRQHTKNKILKFLLLLSTLLLFAGIGAVIDQQLQMKKQLNEMDETLNQIQESMPESSCGATVGDYWIKC